MKIPVEWIQPNPEQPRKEFSQVELVSLADSIAEHGLIVPIIVTEDKTTDRCYFLVDGERRLRAHQLLGRDEIEATVIDRAEVSDIGNSSRERFLGALIANLQRSNLNVVEEAEAFRRMSDELGMSDEEIARQAGYSEATVYSRKTLLQLEPQIQNLFARKALPYDFTVIAALLSLPEGTRLVTAMRFAQRRTPAKWIVSTCKRMVQQAGGSSKPAKPAIVENSEKTREKNLIPSTETNPAIKRAAARLKAPAKETHYNAISQVGLVPPWPQVRASVEAECKKCPLFDYASDSTCKQCPLPGFLARLLENTHGENDGKN